MSTRLLAIAMILATSATLTGCTSIHFGRPWFLLLAIPAAVVTYITALREPATMLGNRGTELDGLVPTWRVRARVLPRMLHVGATLAVIVALAQPQSREIRDEKVDGIDIMLAFDMSGSMLAVDMSLTEIRAYQMQQNANPPNRFDHAKVTLKRFVDGRSRDRIGMVVFAKDAYLQFPLPLDYSTIQGLLDRLQLTNIDPGGTAIGNALGLATRGLMDSEAASRTVILITDGKQHGGNISPLHAAEIARDEGIRIAAILVGREGETLVPRQPFSPRPSNFYPESYPVDPELLQEIADMTNGGFYRAAQPEQLEVELNKILDELETTRLRDVANVQATERFMHFAFLAALLIALAVIVDVLWVRRFP